MLTNRLSDISDHSIMFYIRLIITQTQLFIDPMIIIQNKYCTVSMCLLSLNLYKLSMLVGYINLILRALENYGFDLYIYRQLYSLNIIKYTEL